MTEQELELVARLVYWIRNKSHMPDREPANEYEAGLLEQWKRSAAAELEKEARHRGYRIEWE